MLPVTTIHKLSDHFGEYVISIRCLACRHSRDVEPQVLARRCGWDARLESVVARLRCSKCASSKVDVQIGFSRRPRRWNKNPS